MTIDNSDNLMMSPGYAESIAFSAGPAASVSTAAGRQMSKVLLGSNVLSAGGKRFDDRPSSPPRPPLHGAMETAVPNMSNDDLQESKTDGDGNNIETSKLIKTETLYSKQSYGTIMTIEDPNINAYGSKEPIDEVVASAKRAQWSGSI